MIPFKSKEAPLVAELTKDIAMKIAFQDKNSMQEKYGNIYGYIFDYTVWFADVLLHCDNSNISDILFNMIFFFVFISTFC